MLETKYAKKKGEGMGILFDKTMELKRKFLIEELKMLNVTTSQDGTCLEQLSYEDLEYELILACFRKIDIEKEEQKWF